MRSTSTRSALAGLGPRLKRSGLSNVHPVAIRNESDVRVKRLNGKCDRVLVDAPCSGSGTLRRNPDLKWRFSETELARVNEVQHAVLRAAARLRQAGRARRLCDLLAARAREPARGRSASSRSIPTSTSCRPRRCCGRRRSRSTTWHGLRRTSSCCRTCMPPTASSPLCWSATNERSGSPAARNPAHRRSRNCRGRSTCGNCVVIVGALAGGWLFNRSVQQRVDARVLAQSREPSRRVDLLRFSIDGFRRLAFPVAAMALLILGGLGLRAAGLVARPGDVQFLRLAVTLLGAMAAIRLFVYVMRRSFPRSGLARLVRARDRAGDLGARRAARHWRADRSDRDRWRRVHSRSASSGSRCGTC